MKLFLYGDEDDNETMSQDELDSLLIACAARKTREQHKDHTAWPLIVQIDKLEIGEALTLDRFTEAKRIR